MFACTVDVAAATASPTHDATIAARNDGDSFGIAGIYAKDEGTTISS
ncbi:MAG: hypothetical protein KatS3mg053_1322 [Candidatus Roseilinea sp.]|jgi:hypothetical protein|nr:MAG: hypothetical protein KatS3mg053_1322 [Candidatus Roseilinea sp.]